MASDFSRREAEEMPVPLYAEEASLAKRIHRWIQHCVIVVPGQIHIQHSS